MAEERRVRARVHYDRRDYKWHLTISKAFGSGESEEQWGFKLDAAAVNELFESLLRCHVWPSDEWLKKIQQEKQ